MPTIGAIMLQLFTELPTLIRAIQTIMSSKEAHTLEDAVKKLAQHNTPGEPSSPALS